MRDGNGNNPDLEKALLDVVRYGLAGDETSLRQLAGRLIRKPPATVSDGEAFREKLGKLLLDPAGKSHVLRKAASETLPRDAESTLPLVVIGPDLPVDRPALNPEDEVSVSEFLREQREADRLATAGLSPGRTLLLVGPPGVGKTMTARYLASALQLPLVSLDLATLMSSYLGRTGQNLRRALDYARSTRCVLFLDEFDALAKRRDDDSDVGELKRLVNVLLLELEHWPNDSILVAATNHPELLDRAIERRFEVVIQLSLPDRGSRMSIVASALAASGRTLSDGLLEACAAATEGWSGSDLVRLCRLVLRREILEGTSLDRALAAEVTRSLASRPEVGPSQSDAKAAFAAIASIHGGLPQREIAGLLGVSHPTVGRLIKRWQTQSNGGQDGPG